MGIPSPGTVSRGQHNRIVKHGIAGMFIATSLGLAAVAATRQSIIVLVAVPSPVLGAMAGTRIGAACVRPQNG
jgi:hypothetical protein